MPSYNTENANDLLSTPTLPGQVSSSAAAKAPVAKKGEDPEKLKARLAKEAEARAAKAKKIAESQAKMEAKKAERAAMQSKRMEARD